ncbi:hypothetical protein GGTG_04069 [Gaeumannomyces tritici R3-111a-1]|uniref:Uncharacterized protein n=1 Tax=Gaeumannomyces tritici (strain R3-111a-1) TaxID=644352 RepID=J3NS22_GAET3|nr:hypothetical protein GGTG_04069 [Gaeumannomyces tritici R3-111a-1]EJT78978.1 hypothetical protein GGTG_04069 [Gaeumannomyces tritici R3-111a-1]
MVGANVVRVDDKGGLQQCQHTCARGGGDDGGGRQAARNLLLLPPRLVFFAFAVALIGSGGVFRLPLLQDPPIRVPSGTLRQGGTSDIQAQRLIFAQVWRQGPSKYGFNP